MMIIEFFGCPGAGKSSICKRVMEELASEGAVVKNIHKDEKKKGKLSRKMLSARALMSPRLRGLKKALDDYADPLPGQGRPWKRDVLNSAYKLGQRYVRKADYIFMEEGPTQYISSIAHDRMISDRIRPLVDEMNRTFYDHYVVSFCIMADRDEVIDRIRKRNRAKDRFNSDDESIMRSLIDTKIANLDCLAGRLGYRHMYRIENRDLDEAVGRVTDLIHNIRASEEIQ